MTSTPDDLVESLKSLARLGDSAAIEALLAQSDPRQAVNGLASAQRDLYWIDKNVPAMVIVSRAGIKHLLKSVDRSPEAEDAGHHAKALAYNLGSFTWPGWNEPGIVLSAADVGAGLEASGLNLRLADELNRPEKAKAKAYWLLGAHQLAASAYVSASESFCSGKPHAERSDDTSLGPMLDGYLLLTRVLSEPGNGQTRREFDSSLSRLRSDGTEDRREYANQLTTALTALEERAQTDSAG
jgi:hypothetical protein